MLSQEELDKLLEEGGGEAGGESAEAGKGADAPSGEAAAREPINQDDIDSLLEQGNEGAEEEAMRDDGGPSAGDDLDWGDAFAEAAAGGDAAAAKAVSEGVVSAGDPPPDSGPTAAAPEFDEFRKSETEPSAEQKDNLDFILGLPLEISVELGRKKIQIKDLLKLGQGSVVELNKMAGEPAEIYVNQKLMAKGEVVVVNEKFGVKLSEIISPADRVKSLG